MDTEAPGLRSLLTSTLFEYDMNCPERGLAIIINNRNFDTRTEQLERVGTEVDGCNIERCLMRLGFCVTTHTDASCLQMLDILRKASDEDHSQRDCFVCVILSHGLDGRVFGIDGTVTTNQILNPFKGDRCPSLVGKPKLFFIQACRGTKYDRGVASVSHQDEVDSVQAQRIPVEADFLISYSVGSGYFSWRNSVDGSWYIQALCKVLEEHGEELELLHLLTYVNRLVAYEYESQTGDAWTEGCKQVPSIVSQLTKLVRFKSKYT